MTDFTKEQKEFLENLILKLRTTIDEKATEIRKEVNDKAAEIKTEVAGQLNILKTKIDDVEKENKTLKQHILNLERRVRKNNIAIFGIQESEENIVNAICTVFQNILGLQITEEDGNDAYRLTNNNSSSSINNNKRPIIVELVSYQKKVAILKNAKKLKGSNIYITKDLCIEDRSRNKILTKHLKLARSKGNSAYIRGNKLIVSNETYTAEELEAEIEVTETIEKPKSGSAPASPLLPANSKRAIEELDAGEKTQQKKSRTENPRKAKHIITRSNSVPKNKKELEH